MVANYDNPQGSALGTNGATATATPPAYSYTVTAGLWSSILIVTPYTETGVTTAVSGVTYNGVALTQAGSSGAIVTYYRSVDVWYLLNPPAGTANVQVTWAAAVSNSNCNVVTLTGVKQQAPSVEATVVTGNGSASPSTISITTATDGSLVFGGICFNQEVVVTMTTGTLLKSTFASDGAAGGSAGAIGYAIKAAHGSQSLVFVQSGAAAYVAIAVAFAPAVYPYHRELTYLEL